MVDSLQRFTDLLDQVPVVLLTPDDERVLTDARTSAGVLESIDVSPVTVVLVGSTGVGKSYIMNDVVGMNASEVGVLRPTTTRVIMAGSYGPATVDHASEYVLAPGTPDGIVIVDTPAWETDSAAVDAALVAADIGVLVVTPSRYADVTTHELWAAMEGIPQRLVVLNRQRGNAEDRDVIISSARERFVDVPVFEIAENGNADRLLGVILERSSDRLSARGKATIARLAATEAGRYVAGALTASAMDLGILGGAINDIAPTRVTGAGLSVLETWSGTSSELVSEIRRHIEDVDRRIVAISTNGVARRMALALGPWQSELFEARLDEWRDDAARSFRSNASIRWRRSLTEQLLDRASWKIGVNPEVRVVKRVSRVMGRRLGIVAGETHGSLVSIMNQTIEERRSRWRAAVAEAGSFKPGELLAAVDMIDTR